MLYWFLANMLRVNNVVFADGGSPVPAGNTTGNTSNGTTVTVSDPLGCSSDPSGSPIVCVLNRINGAIFAISIPIVTLMVLIGAFQILTAAGNAEKVTKGRNTIMYAAIGFVVVLFAGGITSIIRSILSP